MTTPNPEPPAPGRNSFGDFLIDSVGATAALMSVAVIAGGLLVRQLDGMDPHTARAVIRLLVAIALAVPVVVLAGCFAVKGIQAAAAARDRTPRDDRRCGRDERGDMNLTPVLLGALIIVVVDANIAPLVFSYIRHHNFRQGFHQLMLGDMVLVAGFAISVTAAEFSDRRARNRLVLETAPGTVRSATPPEEKP